MKTPAFTIRMVAGFGDFPIEEWREKLNLNVVGANTMDAITGLSKEMIKTNTDLSNFFLSIESICILSEAMMERNHFSIGDTVLINLFYQYYDEHKALNYEKLALFPMQIVGKMEKILLILSSYLRYYPPI